MKKLMLSLFLIFFVSLSTARVYGYIEDSSTSYLSEDTTTIKIVESMSSNNGKELVPTGAILGINDSEQITYTYKVFVQEGLTFEYYINNISINNEITSQDIKDLFNFEFQVKQLEKEEIQANLFDEKIEGNYFEITVILSMNFPTEEQYYNIAGQQLYFEFFVETEL